MKQILFRGKRKDNTEDCGKWIQGQITLDTGEAYIWCILDEYRSKDNFSPRGYKVDRSTVGQYTELNDKNGNMIFEGDIVKRESMAPGGIDFIGTVVFREGAYLLDNEKDGIPLFTEIDTLEIIGNIHDNPELIK